MVQLLFTLEGRVPHVNVSKRDREACSINCELTPSSINFLHVLALPLLFFFTSTLNKEFRFVLTQFKMIVMERIRKPLHYIYKQEP